MVLSFCTQVTNNNWSSCESMFFKTCFCTKIYIFIFFAENEAEAFTIVTFICLAGSYELIKSALSLFCFGYQCQKSERK
jgi:hypothetical protein